MRFKHFISSSVLATCFTFGILPNASAHNYNYGHYGVNHASQSKHNDGRQQHYKQHKQRKHHEKRQKHRNEHRAYREHRHNNDCGHHEVARTNHRPQWRINIDYRNIGSWRSSYSY